MFYEIVSKVVLCLSFLIRDGVTKGLSGKPRCDRRVYLKLGHYFLVVSRLVVVLPVGEWVKNIELICVYIYMYVYFCILLSVEFVCFLIFCAR